MITPCHAARSLPHHRREGAAHDPDLFARTSTIARLRSGPWVLHSMRLPVPYASKGMHGTASDGICAAAIGSRGGCISTGTPSPRLLPHSSTAMSAGCHGPVLPSGRGALPSPSPSGTATPAFHPVRCRAADGCGPLAAALCTVFGAGLRDRRQHSTALSAYGPAVPGRVFWNLLRRLARLAGLNLAKARNRGKVDRDEPKPRREHLPDMRFSRLTTYFVSISSLFCSGFAHLVCSKVRCI